MFYSWQNVCIIIIILLYPVKAITKTINVPEDFLTIQEALNTASDGDIVSVSQGRYHENIIWPVINDIKLIGEGKSNTIIDGGKKGITISLVSPGCVAFIQSVSIINGEVDSSNDIEINEGAGINCLESTLHLSNVVICDNIGAGIYSVNSEIELTNVTISDNSVGVVCRKSSLTLSNVNILDNYGHGGVQILESNLLISNAIISRNSAYLGQTAGGGIGSFINSNINISNTTISENYSFLGGGICCLVTSELKLSDVIVSGNYASQGGGIVCGLASQLKLSNVSVSGNYANQGGGLLLLLSTTEIKNSIIWYNSPQAIFIQDEPYPLIIKYSSIQNGKDGIHFSEKIEDTIFQFENNISTKPQFIDPYGNYNLKPGSPCINSGDPDFDNDGITYENDPDDQDVDGTRMDMGALFFLFAISLDIPETASENDGFVNGSVFIDSIFERDVVVQLISSDHSCLTVPSLVTIPSGKLSTDFLISIVDNDAYNASKNLKITASCSQWLSDTETMMITDNELMVNILYPPNKGPVDPEHNYIFGNASDLFNNLSKVEFIVSNESQQYFYTQNVTPEASTTFVIDTSENPWKKNESYIISATVYNSIGYTSSCSIISGAVTSEISCQLSKKQIIAGEPLTVTGHLFPIPSKSGFPIDIKLYCSKNDKSIYLNPVFTNQQGEFTSIIDCRFIDKTGEWTVQAIWQGESQYLSSESKPQPLKVIPSKSRISISASSHNVKIGEKITIDGKLSFQTDCEKGLLEKNLTINVVNPQGVESKHAVMTENIFGNYQLRNLLDFDQLGIWTVRTEFIGTDAYSPCVSDAIDIHVVESAGYAIIVQGKIKDGEGLLSHNKTTKFVYNQLKQRGFFVDESNFETQHNDDIFYLNYNIEQNGVDGIPTRTSIQNAITTWAKQKMNSKPANLYIIMIDHGLNNQFFVYQTSSEEDTISANDLGTWVDTLQSGLLSQDAKSQEIVFILGFCHSGSFIPSLSGPNRIIITSASENESSYKGPKETDETGNILRDGEYFVSELFKKIALGYSLAQAFEASVQLTEQFTLAATGSLNSSYFDHSLQHPLLDDNGDKQGSNDLSDPSGDGTTSHSIFLGVSKQTENDPGDVSIVNVAESLFLSANQDSTDQIWARVIPNERLRKMWIEIKSPDLTTNNQPIKSIQREMDLTVIPYSPFNYNFILNRFEWSNVSYFSSPGMYQVFYFAMDDLTGNVSSLMETRVYKARDNNQIPEEFSLLSPVHKSDHKSRPVTKTALIFDWEDSSDLDNDKITYTLIVSKHSNIHLSTIRKENLTHSACLISRYDGLENFTTYYWQVLAIDFYGGIQQSDIWEFYTDDPDNPIWGAIEAHVYDGITGNSIDNAEIRLGNLSTFNNIENGYFLDLVIPGDDYQVSIRAKGYADAVFDNIVIPKMDTVTKTFKLLPSSLLPGDMNINGRIDLGDVVLGLQFLSKFNPQITIPIQVDADGDGGIGLSDVIYVMQRL